MREGHCPLQLKVGEVAPSAPKHQCPPQPRNNILLPTWTSCELGKKETHVKMMFPSLRVGGFHVKSTVDLGAAFRCVIVSCSASHFIVLVLVSSSGTSQYPTAGPVALCFLACKNIPCHGRLAEVTLTEKRGILNTNFCSFQFEGSFDHLCDSVHAWCLDIDHAQNESTSFLSFLGVF